MTSRAEVLQAKKELAILLAEKEKRLKYDKFRNYFFQDHFIDPSTGMDISRKGYQPHVDLMNATADFRELAFIAPNRSGKSEAGAFIIACLATGEYPDWWEGKRFPLEEPLEILVLGKTNTAVRDVAQKKLVGTLFDPGTGMIPKEYIHDMRKKPGNPDALLDLYVKNKAGTINHIQFLSYEVDDDVVMGRELHAAWFDEECLKQKLYNETLMRTMTTKGFVFTTFTPLDGFTEGIQRFIPTLQFPKDGVVRDENDKETGRYVTHCGWKDAPHLTEEDKVDIARRYTGAELIARTEGIPTIGAGQVYPYTREQITCEPFKIPDWWPRAYGLDFGWHGEAVVWGAQDPDTGDIYIYSEYYAAQKPSALKISEILEKMDRIGGKWMYGAADPSGGGRSADGILTMDLYTEKGFNLVPGINSLAIISKIQGMFESGQLKIMPHCQELLNEIAIYKFDDKDSRPARNQRDHECDALKYLISVFERIAQPKPDPDEEADLEFARSQYSSGRNPITGY